MDRLFSKEAIGLYARIWGQIQNGNTLTGDTQLIAEAMQAHPEFNPYWLQGEAAFQPQEIDGYVVNPLVHIGLHVAVEKQLADESPPEITAVFSSLLRSGLSRHDTIHKIAALWGDHYFRSVRRGSPLDQMAYAIELAALVSEMATE